MQVSGAVVLSVGWVGRFPHSPWHLISCSSQGPRGGGTWPFSPRSQSPHSSASVSLSRGTVSRRLLARYAGGITPVDLSRHSLLTDNSLSEEQQTDPVPCGLTAGDIRAQGVSVMSRSRGCAWVLHALSRKPSSV